MAAPLVFLVIVLLFLLTPNPGREALFKGLFPGKIPDNKYLAVLPFITPEDNPKIRAYCAGTTARIIARLTSLEQFEKKFWVVPIRNLQHYDVKSVKKAGFSFKITLAITGSLAIDQDRVTLELNLVDAQSHRILRTGNLSYHITNLSGLQDGIIRELVEMLDIEWEPIIEITLTSGGTSLPGAYRLYLQGLGFLQESKNKKSISQSINMFHQAIEQDNSYDEAYASLGEACLIMYRLSKEKSWLKKAKSYCNRALKINKKLYKVHIISGYIHNEDRNYENAIKDFQQALDINPECFLACQEMAITFDSFLGEKNKAEEEFKNAIKLRTDYWKGYEWLAFFYYNSGRHLEAEENLHKVIDLNPVNIWAYNTLITIYNKIGDKISAQKAREIFNKSLKIGPNGYTYTNMGNNLFYYQKRYSESRDMYKKAIEVGKDNPNIFFLWGNLADSLRLMGGHDRDAREAYHIALQLVQQKLLKKTDDAFMRSSLALYLSKLGDFNQAILEMDKALKLDPNYLEVLQNSVVVFELSGKRERALYSLEELIKRQGAIAQLIRNPFLSDLHNDPQYVKLVNPSNSINNKGNEGKQ
jgi:tetratricopeptide (TPR) repeat protein/TolB-like protein